MANLGKTVTFSFILHILITRKIKPYLIELIYQAYRLHCVLNPYIKLLLTLVWVKCLYRRYRNHCLNTKLSTFYLHFPGTGTSFSLNYTISNLLLCHNNFWENLCRGIPQLDTGLHPIHISEKERTDDNVRHYYDDEKKWDFSAILHANTTKMFTNILKINQVFKFGSHYNPQGQSASL